MTARPYAVGLLGAGAVAQAIHVPAVARSDGRLTIASVMDPDRSVAARVAGPWGARVVESEAALLEDDDLDVVVICSPHREHARQLVHATTALPDRPVLCEKPLAYSGDDAEGLSRVSESSRVVVGAMHLYDPAWRSVQSAWADGVPGLIRSTIVLPPNSIFVDSATQLVSPGPAASRPSSGADRLRTAILGLAIHDLPMIRRLTRSVDFSLGSVLQPDGFGYAVDMTVGRTSVELFAVMTDDGAPDWRFEAHSATLSTQMWFPPSYVDAGSAHATLSRPGYDEVVLPSASNGYDGEWARLIAILDGVEEAPPFADHLADIDLALRLADAVTGAGRW